MTVTAPGKVFLAGEYAVLHGGTAIVAAISRRASARYVPEAQAASPLIAEAVRLAREWVGASAEQAPGSVIVDSSALFSGDRKLGLGSSAAAGVAAVAAVVDAAGIGIGGKRGAIRRMAWRAHRTHQGGLGSGADVAASAYGGLLAVTRRDSDLAVDRLPALPAELVVFSTETSSSTVDCLKAVTALGQRQPEEHARLVSAIGTTAAVFRHAVENADAALLLGAVRGAHVAMNALGQAAGVPIVTPVFSAAASAAAELGGAAKPSGAGGGDVGVAFFPTPAGAGAFRARAPDLGITILDLAIDPLGVVVERQHVARPV